MIVHNESHANYRSQATTDGDTPLTNNIDKPDIACTLTENNQQHRKSILRTEVLKHLVSTQEMERGIKLTFNESAALRTSLEALVELESQCCGFLSFDISSSKDGLSLSVGGPPDAKEFIQTFLVTFTDTL